MRHFPNSRHLVRLDVLGVILDCLYSYEHPAVGSRVPVFYRVLLAKRGQVIF